MRKITFGTYDTETNKLTLTGWQLSAATAQTNLVSVPGRDGSLDLSFALTDGEPTYASRNLTATFETSEDDRLTRLGRLLDMVNELDGRRLNIVLPDDADHYVVGRCHVEMLYNDPAHGSIKVTAVCDPWRYAAAAKTATLTATSTEQTKTLTNAGRKLVAPTLTVTGTVSITFGSLSWELTAGTYVLPDLILQRGDNAIGYSGTGTIVVTYREAVL